jgi:CheY-like chemotaxis protein
MHKLLLADDSVTIQRVIELTFSGEDVQVLAVNDGEQAIARIPLERPDVVLADIGMPRKGGYDVSAFVKGRPDLAHIPVLLLAGAFEPVDQARAEQVRADGVLIKPFEPRQVIERVKELLALRQVPAAPDAPPQPEESAQPVPEAVADPVAVAGSEGNAGQSLDELFESLNHALTAKQETPPEVQMKTQPERPPDPSLASDPEPKPEPLLIEPPAPFEPLTPAPASRASLDDYFDRLSVAFEHASGPPTTRLFQPLPDRLEDPALPAPQAPPVAAPARAAEWPAQEWLSPGGTTFSFERRGEEANPILEAVTALMAQGSVNGSTQDVPPARSDAPVVAPTAAAAPSQEMVDAVAQRVLARLAPEVAETLRRLVAQEIARSQHDVR